MPQYWCYICNNFATINEAGDLLCQVCNQDFLEERRVLIPPQVLAIIQALMEREALDESFNMEQPSDVKPATEEFVNSLSNVMLTNKEIQENCSVCLDNFKEELKGCKLPCGHIFHEDCIKEWLSKHNNRCPVCRVEFQASEEV